MVKKFVKGDTVYNESWDEFAYQGFADGMHVVKPVLVDSDCDPVLGRAVVLYRVFKDYPENKVHPKWKEHRKTLKNLGKEIEDLKSKLRKAEAEQLSSSRKRWPTGAEEMRKVVLGDIKGYVSVDKDGHVSEQSIGDLRFNYNEKQNKWFNGLYADFTPFASEEGREAIILRRRQVVASEIVEAQDRERAYKFYKRFRTASEPYAELKDLAYQHAKTQQKIDEKWVKDVVTERKKEFQELFGEEEAVNHG